MYKTIFVFGLAGLAAVSVPNVKIENNQSEIDAHYSWVEQDGYHSYIGNNNSSMSVSFGYGD
jgi:hypothetical protein